MCKANDKLTLFSYALGKFVTIQQEKERISSDDALKTFSNIRIMKLLYCLCLESLEGHIGNQFHEGGESTKNLFSFFGAFKALPNGPVQIQVYEALDIVPGFKYKDGHFCEQTTPTNKLISPEFNQKYPDFVQMVDEAIIGLQNNMDYDVFKDRKRLVDLTHQLPLWKEAFMYKSGKEMSNTPQDLQREYEEYAKLRKQN